MPPKKGTKKGTAAKGKSLIFQVTNIYALKQPLPLRRKLLLKQRKLQRQLLKLSKMKIHQQQEQLPPQLLLKKIQMPLKMPNQLSRLQPSSNLSCLLSKILLRQNPYRNLNHWNLQYKPQKQMHQFNKQQLVHHKQILVICPRLIMSLKYSL